MGQWIGANEAQVESVFINKPGERLSVGNLVIIHTAPLRASALASSLSPAASPFPSLHFDFPMPGSQSLSWTYLLIAKHF